MRGSNSRPLACEASVIATTPTRLLFRLSGMGIRRNRFIHSFKHSRIFPKFIKYIQTGNRLKVQLGIMLVK